MARTKNINPCTQWGDTDWITNNCGGGVFELYNIKTKQILAKSNNPMDFDKYIDKIFGKKAARNVRNFKTEQEKGGA